jgi:hypothetical protein
MESCSICFDDDLAQEASESQPARVVRLWAKKREAWATRFEGQSLGQMTSEVGRFTSVVETDVPF